MAQRYLEEALAWIGTQEIPGIVSNQNIVMFHSYTSLHSNNDSVPWCSSFVNYIVQVCDGIGKGTGSAAARSWLDWGRALATPEPGCIVVIDRKDAQNPHAAHVGIYVCDGKTPQTISVLGGNQHDSVCVTEFPRSKIIGFRETK